MNNLKKIIVFTLIALVLPFTVSAQRRGEVNKELQEFKIKFLAQEMELTADQQPKFVEVYTRMTNEKKRIFKNAIELQKRVKRDKKASSADYQRATEAMSKAKIQEGKIDERYDNEFRKFLSPKQIYKMKEGEKKFRAKMKELRRQHKR